MKTRTILSALLVVSLAGAALPQGKGTSSGAANKASAKKKLDAAAQTPFLTEKQVGAIKKVMDARPADRPDDLRPQEPTNIMPKDAGLPLSVPPTPQALTPTSAPVQAAEPSPLWRLKGVVVNNEGGAMALFDAGRPQLISVRNGEKFGDAKVLSIHPGYVVIEHSGRRQRLYPW